MAEPVKRTPVFASVYEHGVDEKRRLQIPSKWRAGTQDMELMLTVWPNSWQKEASIMVYPPEVFEKMVARLAERSFTDPEADSLRRFIGERSDTATIDRAGRICLPETMAHAIGLKKESVLVGMLDRFQIWTPEAYKESKIGNDAVAANAWKQF